MRQMNMEELREGINLGRAVIEDNLIDMYITKKLLVNEGFPEEDLDGFIAGKVREYDQLYTAMEDEEFLEKLPEVQDEIREAGERSLRVRDGGEPDFEEDPEYLEELEAFMAMDDDEDSELPEGIEVNPIAVLQGMINVIDIQVKKVMMVKRSLALAGVDPGEVGMAIADTAKEYDERYMKMSRAEIEQAMFRRMAEIDETLRAHPEG